MYSKHKEEKPEFQIFLALPRKEKLGRREVTGTKYHCRLWKEEQRKKKKKTSRKEEKKKERES